MGRLKICLYSLLNISPRTDNSWGGNPKTRLGRLFMQRNTEMKDSLNSKMPKKDVKY